MSTFIIILYQNFRYNKLQQQFLQDQNCSSFFVVGTSRNSPKDTMSRNKYIYSGENLEKKN